SDFAAARPGDPGRGRLAAAARSLAGPAAALVRAGLAGHGVGRPVPLPGPLGGQRLRRPARLRALPGAPLRADALVAGGGVPGGGPPLSPAPRDAGGRAAPGGGA